MALVVVVLLLLLLWGPSPFCPIITSALGLLYNPKHSTQHTFSSPVPRINRQRSLTEAVLISFGSTNRFPKTLQRWWANTSQHQTICCTVSVSFLQNLQVGSPSNRPMICRCPLTGVCPVRIATTILSWCLHNLSRSSAFFLHSLHIKSLPCLSQHLLRYDHLGDMFRPKHVA
jgi:hypothetical protein